MNKNNLLVAGSVFLSVLLTGCGGGGSSSATSATPTPPPFNYAAINGTYRCVDSRTFNPLTLKAVFTATSVVFTSTGVIAGLTFEYKDKVGMILGMPYYSHNIALTSSAESAFFFNNNLTLVTTPSVDVPDLFAQRPTSQMNCTKTA